MLGGMLYVAMMLVTATVLVIVWFREDSPDDPLLALMASLMCMLVSLFWPIVLPAAIIAIIGVRFTDDEQPSTKGIK